MHKNHSKSSALLSKLRKEWTLQNLASTPEGQFVTVEGFVTALGSRSQLQEEECGHTMQVLSLASNYLPIGDNSASISVFVILWDRDEFHVEKGEKIRVIDGILREGRVHILQSAQIESIRKSKVNIENKKEWTGFELAKQAEKEVKKSTSYYRQIAGAGKSADGSPFSMVANSGLLKANDIQRK